MPQHKEAQFKSWLLDYWPKPPLQSSPIIHYSTTPSLHFFGLPGRLISRTPPPEGGYAGANPAPAANHSPLAQNESNGLTN
jgi:hypothetical protein